MSGQNIYAMFCKVLGGVKNDVRMFQTRGDRAIILYLTNGELPLLFTVVDSQKEIWTLEPVINTK
jgi:hypothetical protein